MAPLNVKKTISAKCEKVTLNVKKLYAKCEILTLRGHTSVT